MYDSPKAAHFKAFKQDGQLITGKDDRSIYLAGLKSCWAVAQLCVADGMLDLRQPGARERAAQICERFNAPDGDGCRIGLPIVKLREAC